MTNVEEHKGYRIVPTEKFTFYRIINEGSGKVSNTLSGAYTDARSAKVAIDQLKAVAQSKEEAKRPVLNTKPVAQVKKAPAKEASKKSTK